MKNYFCYFYFFPILFILTVLIFPNLSAQELTEEELTQVKELIPELTGKKEKVNLHDKDEIIKLIDLLGHDDFKFREKATKDLTAKESTHKNLLIEASQSPDPEKKERAKKVLVAWEKKEKTKSETKILHGQQRFFLLRYFRTSVYKGELGEFQKVYKALLKIDTKKQAEVKYLIKNLTDMAKDYIQGQISHGPTVTRQELLDLAETLLQNPKLSKAARNQILSDIITFHLADNQLKKVHDFLLKYQEKIKSLAEFQEKLFSNLNRIKNQDPKIDYFTADVETIKTIANLIPLSMHKPLSSGNCFMSNKIQYQNEEKWKQALKWADGHGNNCVSLMEHEFAFYIHIIYSKIHPEYTVSAKQATDTFFKRVFSNEKLKDRTKLEYYLNFLETTSRSNLFPQQINEIAAKFAPKAIGIYQKHSKNIYEGFSLAKALNFSKNRGDEWKDAGETLCNWWEKKKFYGSDSRYIPQMLELYLNLGKKEELKSILAKKKRIWRYPANYAALANNGASKLAVEYLSKHWKLLDVLYSESFSRNTLSDNVLSELDSQLENENPDFALFAKIFFANFAGLGTKLNKKFFSEQVKYIETERLEKLVQQFRKHQFANQALKERCLDLLARNPYCFTLLNEWNKIFPDEKVLKFKNTKSRKIQKLWANYIVSLLHAGDFDTLSQKLKLLTSQGPNEKPVRRSDSGSSPTSFFAWSVITIHHYLIKNTDYNSFTPENGQIKFSDRLKLPKVTSALLEGVNDYPADGGIKINVTSMHYAANALHGEKSILNAAPDIIRIFGNIEKQHPRYSLGALDAVFAGMKNDIERKEVLNTLLESYGSEEVKETFFDERGTPLDAMQASQFYKANSGLYDFEMAKFHYEKTKNINEADRLVKTIILCSENNDNKEKAQELFWRFHANLKTGKDAPRKSWPTMEQKMSYKTIAPQSGINILAPPSDKTSPFPTKNSFIMNWNISKLFKTNYYDCLKKSYITDESDFKEWDGKEEHKCKNHIFNKDTDWDQIGKINLYGFFKPVKPWQVVYLSTYLYSPKNKTAKLLSASNTHLKIFLNGKEAMSTGKYPRSNIKLDAYCTEIELQKGLNHLIIKSAYNGRKEWWLRIRFIDEQGRPFQVKALPAK